MRFQEKVTVAVIAAALLTGCGVSDVGAAPGAETAETFDSQTQAVVAFPDNAIRLALVSVRHFGGDPGTTRVEMKLELDDSAVRAAYPDFDGLESVYVDIPGLAPGWNERRALKYLRTEGDVDVYIWSDYFTSGLVDEGWRNPFVFGLSTNVGHFHDVAKGVRVTDKPIDLLQ